MFTMPKYKERISLIPGGCPQLLDFAADLNAIPKMRRNFEERPFVSKELFLQQNH